MVLSETQKAAESVIRLSSRPTTTSWCGSTSARPMAPTFAAWWWVGKVVAAMRRQASREFRSNLHRGGEASAIKITPEERATAVQAAKIMGLDVAGVDILRSARGPWCWR